MDAFHKSWTSFMHTPQFLYVDGEAAIYSEQVRKDHSSIADTSNDEELSYDIQCTFWKAKLNEKVDSYSSAHSCRKQ